MLNKRLIYNCYFSAKIFLCSVSDSRLRVDRSSCIAIIGRLCLRLGLLMIAADDYDRLDETVEVLGCVHDRQVTLANRLEKWSASNHFTRKRARCEDHLIIALRYNGHRSYNRRETRQVTTSGYASIRGCLLLLISRWSSTVTDYYVLLLSLRQGCTLRCRYSFISRLKRNACMTQCQT